METPFVAFSNDELASQPNANAGDMIHCDLCGGSHQLQCGSMVNGKPSNTLLFFSCSEKTYLAAVEGKLITGLFPQVWTDPNLDEDNP